MYKVSAPGSVMLLGEHAVLHSYSAIVCAIDKRLTVSLFPNKNSQQVTISSNLGYIEYSLKEIQGIKSSKINSKFLYIINIIRLFATEFQYGFNLRIESNILSTVGFGSSAAVTSATVATFLYWRNNTIPTSKEVFDISKKIILSSVGLSSGSDLIASIYGGIIQFNPSTYSLCPLPSLPHIIAIYSGYKVSTKKVVEKIQLEFQNSPNSLNKIYNQMGDYVEKAVLAIKNSDWQETGMLMNKYHTLMCDLGVSDPTIEHIIHELRKQPGIYGTKISGSGLGDCVIGLGDRVNSIHSLTNLKTKYSDFILRVSKHGLVYHNT